MYDININNVKKGKKFYLLFLVVGLLFFIIVGSLLIYKLIKLSTLKPILILKVKQPIHQHIIIELMVKNIDVDHLHLQVQDLVQKMIRFIIILKILKVV